MPRFPLLPDYRLIRRIGGGTDSDVYAAETVNGAPVAIKVSNSPRQVVRARFRREIEIGTAVRHSNLVRIIRGQADGHRPFLVMDFVPGVSLKTRLEAHGRMGCEVTLGIVRQLAEALAALHLAGLIHGDVKPANVMIPTPGHAVLVDLGFAHRPGESETVLGTANYVAPELCATPVRDSFAVDMFALGVTLFELLTGRLPYSAGTRSDVMRSHRDDRPDRLTDHHGPWPDKLNRLVDELVGYDPFTRPTASEVVRRIAELQIELWKQAA